MNISCVPGGTALILPGTNICICSAAYYGDHCQFILPWWFALTVTNHVIEGMILLIMLAWSMVIVVLKVKQRRMVSLAGAGLIIGILASLTRLIFIVTPGVELVPFSTDMSMVLLSSFTLPISIVLWLVATALIMAFWYEIWTRKTKASGTIAQRTKIILIASSVAFFILAVIGLAYLDGATPLGFLIYYVPLGVIILLLLGFTVRLARFDASKLSHDLKAKHAWTTRLFIAVVVNWIIYYITLGVFIFYSNIPASMVGLFLFRFTEATAAIINMLLLDYRAKILRCHNEDKITRMSSTATPSGSNPHSGDGKTTKSALSGINIGTSDTTQTKSASVTDSDV